MKQVIQLYVNEQLLDLFDSDQEPIQSTFQANDIGNLTSVQANYTKQFNIPLTKRNKSILGSPGEIYITGTRNPYNFYPSKLVVNGIEIIPNGKFCIIQVTNETADISITSGNADFLDLLGGQVYDMGDSTSPWSNYGTKLVWKKWDIPSWDVPAAANSQSNTDGWIFPIVNYGDIDITAPFAGHVNVRNIRPAFFLRTAIELLVEFTGYTIDKDRSCLYNNPIYSELYKRMLIQFSNSDFEHGTDWQNTPDNLGATLTKGVDQIISNPRVSIVTSPNIYDNGYPFEGVISFGPTDHYVATTNVDITATVQFNLYMRGRYTGTPSEVIIKFVLIDTDGSMFDFGSSNFVLDSNYTRLGGSGSGVFGEETFLNKKLSQDFSLVAGQQLYVKYHINNIGLLSDNSANTYAIVRGGATMTIVTSERLILWQQPIQSERILPDISQLDLLKYVLQTFGLTLIANPNTGTVTFASFKQIVANIAKAKDWSDKCVDLGKQVNFSLGNYSQINWLRYQKDDTIPLNYMPNFFADDHIDIADKTLNPTQPVADLFQVPFAPSINVPYLGGTIAQMSDPTGTDEYSAPGQPRILIDQKLDLTTIGNKSVVFSDNDSGFETETQTVNGIISVPYFYKPDAPILNGAARHLCWCDKGGYPGLRSTYYSEFQHILNQTKKVVRYFYLTPRDIYEFDPLIPVYLRQDGAFFYVNKIDSWNAGKPCKVELVRL